MTPTHHLYITGGTVPGDALFYIPRRADALLLDALRRSEFCYVLTPRQMGKSSLVVQTARMLHAEGVRVAVIDLQNIGLNMTVEQWYIGLLDSLGRELGLQDELDDFVLAQENLSPLQLWRQALRDVVLPHIGGQLVIFIDEIDIVQGLGFSTDEFFGAIRACYNARAENEEYRRLTFCLLGVASPTDLIRNPRLTPFNIGQRIDLEDFTLEEAAPLRQGLGHDEETNRLQLERIHHWTGGHPYLTQRLCKLVAENGAILTVKGVDDCCRQTFFASSTGHRDDNLIYVQQRLLPEEDNQRAALLTLYQQIWDGKPTADNEANSLIPPLKLSGAVRSEHGYLRVRNLIYRHVFNRVWITDHLPHAERRRQDAAYRRGVLRTAAVACVLFAILGSIATVAVRQWRRAEAATEETRLVLYTADLPTIERAWANGNFRQVEQLLETHLPKPGQKDLRGWEWRYYWGKLHRDIPTFHHESKSFIFSVAFSPKGNLLASARADGTIKVWNAVIGDKGFVLQQPADTDGKKATLRAIAFSPGGRTLASGDESGNVVLWNVATRFPEQTLDVNGRISTLAFSPNSHYLAVGQEINGVTIYETASLRTSAEKPHHIPYQGPIYAVAFSPDSRLLAYGGTSAEYKAEILLWNVTSPAESKTLFPGRTGQSISSIAFRSNEELVAGCTDGNISSFDISTKHTHALLPQHKACVDSIAFSPNGRYMATGSWDYSAKLWDIGSGSVIKAQVIDTFASRSSHVTSLAFSPDSKWLAAGTREELQVWDIANSPSNPHSLQGLPADYYRTPRSLVFLKSGELKRIVTNSQDIRAALWDGKQRCEPLPVKIDGMLGGCQLSPNEQTLAVGTESKVWLLNAKTGERKGFLEIKGKQIGRYFNHIAFSRDGRTLAACQGDPAVVVVWDIASRRQIRSFALPNACGGLSFSPDGKILTFGSWQGMVYDWNYLTTDTPESWSAATNMISDVAYSPDGNTLATADITSVVKLWHVRTRREMMTLYSGKRWITDIAFSPDGTEFAAADDKQIWIWSASTLSATKQNAHE